MSLSKIRYLKSKSALRQELTAVLEKNRGNDEKENKMLLDIIDIDPIHVGSPKFDIVPTRKKWQCDTVQHVQINGHWMEFGVREGTTINWVLEVCPEQQIHGFDSWEGLPETWDTGGHVYSAGEMAVPMPTFPENVHLHKGWFDQTLEPWMIKHRGSVAYLHIDSDLYSSAIYVLKTLNDRIVPGTLIIFDELVNFRLSGKLSNWYKHEWKAMFEWMSEHSRQLQPVARSCMDQVAFRVIK